MEALATEIGTSSIGLVPWNMRGFRRGLGVCVP
jgi:hypothetical protein